MPKCQVDLSITEMLMQKYGLIQAIWLEVCMHLQTSVIHGIIELTVKRIVMFRVVWTPTAILNGGYQLSVSTIFYVWTWNKTYHEAECCKDNDS
jgi:hypothetical protein